jgi:hypothetical protein
MTRVIPLEVTMGFPTRVQLIKRKSSEQWYINFPAALAQACEFVKGEVVEWVVKDKYSLLLQRKRTPSQDTDDGETKKKP